MSKPFPELGEWTLGSGLKDTQTHPNAESEQCKIWPQACPYFHAKLSPLKFFLEPIKTLHCLISFWDDIICLFLVCKCWKFTNSIPEVSYLWAEWLVVEKFTKTSLKSSKVIRRIIHRICCMFFLRKPKKGQSHFTPSSIPPITGTKSHGITSWQLFTLIDPRYKNNPPTRTQAFK